MKLLITGANGFIGNVLADRALANDHIVIAAVRNNTAVSENQIKRVVIPTIDGTTPWGQTLDGIDVVVHLAARAHVLVEHAVKLNG